jgi:ABC-2 type transport system permease protein
MKKLWIIARKDIREAMRSRSTYVYIAIMIALSFTYLSSYNSLIENLKGQNASTQSIYESSRAFLNSITYALPMMYSILVCTIFAAYSVIVDKSKRNLESLMVTPLSLKQIWAGKALSVTVPSVVIGLAVSILGYIIINMISVAPQTGGFIIPEPLAIVTALIIVPVLVLSVVFVVIYMQLIIANPRIANLAFTAIFLALFFSANILTGLGINVNFSYIYLAIAIICGGVSYLLSRSLTKERVLMSSKG